MINTLRHAPILCASVAAVLIAAVIPAFSQAPTDEQRSAIRAQCRSDYEAHCASVPPGGMESLQCLQKNMSSLSSGCQAAVRAVEPAAAPKAESAPAAAPAAAAPAKETAAPASAPKAAATKVPTSSQTAAIRSACRSDYMKVCSGVPTGGAPALQCLEKNKAKVSTACQQAVNAVSGGGAAPAAGASSGGAAGGAAAGAAAAPAPVLVLRPMRPREELFVLRSACGGDVRTLCGGVAPGGGRIIQCLAARSADISPACKDVLVQFSAQ